MRPCGCTLLLVLFLVLPLAGQDRRAEIHGKIRAQCAAADREGRGVAWAADFATAQRRAVAQNKPILVSFAVRSMGDSTTDEL